MGLNWNFDNALRALDGIEKKVATKIEKTVLTKGAEVMLEGQQSTVPVGDTGKLKASLGIGKTKRRKGRAAIHIGVTNDTGRELTYGYYQHYGTRKMVGNYWITNAFKNKLDEAKEVMKKELIQAIKER